MLKLTTPFVVVASFSLLAASVVGDESSRGNLLAPKAFRTAAASIRPSVVMIETFGGVSGGGGKRNPGASFKPGEGPTTGVVISEDGYIVTTTINFVNRAPIITVIFSDGSRRVAKLLGRDETRKLCVLKVEDAAKLSVPAFAPTKELKVGQWAVAIGVGFGEQEPSLSAGIISAVNRVSGKAVQTDANLSPANYGGPLIDLEGRLIGICVPLSPGAKETAAGAEWYDSGIGFAVPLDGLDSLLNDLKAGKSFKHGYLGVQAAPTPDQSPGAIIKQVMPESSGLKAGLKPNDHVLKVNDDEVMDATHLGVLVNKYVHGEVIKLAIKRGTESLTIEATLGDPPKPPPMPMPMVSKPGEKKPAEKPAEEKKEEPKQEDAKPEGDKP